MIRPAGRAIVLASALVALIALPTACRRSHVAGTPSTDAVLTAFKDAKLDVEGVKNADADNWSADVCSAGPIAGLDVVICEYANEQMLAKVEADTTHDWDTVNVDTGVVVRNGRTLLLVVDRTRADPSGRAVNRLVSAFKQAN